MNCNCEFDVVYKCISIVSSNRHHPATKVKATANVAKDGIEILKSKSFN